MTATRAAAYTRAVRTLDELGATLTDEQAALIRSTADQLVFSQDDAPGQDALVAFAAVAAIFDDLIEDERISPLEAELVLDDLWAAGPVKATEPLAA